MSLGVAKIEVDRTDANRVYAAQFAELQADGNIHSSGFYISTDGGVNWTKTLTGLARDLAIDAASSQTLYLAMSRVDEADSPPAGLYKSTNAGGSWARIYTSPYDANKTTDIRVAVTAANSQTIYVYTGGTAGNGFETRVEVSTNGGMSWTNRGGAGLDPAQFGYNTYIVADPANASTVYAGTRDVYKSTDGGVSWANLTNNFGLDGTYHPLSSNSHADQHSFAFSPAGSNTFYIGNDGGISKTTDGGGSFMSLNATLSLSQFVSIAIHPTNPLVSYGGTQDNGTQKRLGGALRDKPSAAEHGLHHIRLRRGLQVHRRRQLLQRPGRVKRHIR